MHGWSGWEWTYGGGLIMGLGMLLTWVIPLGLIVALLVHLKNREGRPERALDILEKAYARGEIGREEFLQKRDDLLGKSSRE